MSTPAIDVKVGPVIASARPGRFASPVVPQVAPAWVLVGIIALGTLLRALKLTVFPFEQDELYTFFESRDLFHVALKPGIAARPLYFLVQHLPLEFLPPTPLVLRAMPFLFGIAGMWLTWKIANRVYGSVAGVIATLMIAVSPWHMHASGFARYWSLVYLLGAAYCYLLWRAYESDDVRFYRASLAILLVGSATHPSFVFAAVGISLGVMLVRNDGSFGWQWPTRRAWINVWLPYFVLALAGAVALSVTGRGSSLQNWSGRGVLASLRLIPAFVEFANPVVVLVAVLAAVFSLYETAAGRRRWASITLCGGFVTFALLLYASTRTDIYADYAFAILPLIFVACGGAVQLLAERMRSGHRTAVWVSGAALTMAVLPQTLSHLSDGTRFDYRPAYAHIASVAPQLPVHTWPLIVARHYAPQLHNEYLSIKASKLEASLQTQGDIWVIASYTRYGIVSDDDGSVEAWLSKRCRLESSFVKPRWDYRQYRVALLRCQR